MKQKIVFRRIFDWENSVAVYTDDDGQKIELVESFITWMKDNDINGGDIRPVDAGCFFIAFDDIPSATKFLNDYYENDSWKDLVHD